MRFGNGRQGAAARWRNYFDTNVACVKKALDGVVTENCFSGGEQSIFLQSDMDMELCPDTGADGGVSTPKLADFF